MNTISKSVVFLSGPEDDHPNWGPFMRFRLTYDGILRATNRDPLEEKPDLLAVHKHTIRAQFHEQLKQHWQTDKFLSAYRVRADDGTRIPYSESVAQEYENRGFRFVPLVRDEMSLLCSLSILFLRRDPPGSLVSAGDLDNRIKTVIDALRIPQKPNEFMGKDRKPITPEAGQDPFYCLMEDDKQVSHLSVETDMLLDPPTDDEKDKARVKLIITVELRPYYVTMDNMSFS